MKKCINYIISFLIVMFSFSLNIYATDSYGRVTKTLIVRSGPGTKYSIVSDDLDAGTVITILESINTNDGSTGCGSGVWYKIKEVNGGHVCSSFVESINVEIDSSFENSLTNFPESYRSKLSLLHSLYPNWTFVPINTGLDFNEATSVESYGGRGLINTSNEGWRSTTSDSGYDWENDTWPGMDGSSWKVASKDITAYYMDPRNFLTETGIFQFEELYYNPTIADSTVQYALNGTFMSGTFPHNNSTKSYSSTFIESGSRNNINPVFLATMVIQEVGRNGSGSTSGKVSGYEGYYNFFNIGAYKCNHKDSNGNCISTDPVINGLITAKNNGWNSQYKSITEGVGGTIVTNYINKEATTRYFFKYNVNPARWAYYNKYTNGQYMTNIQDPSSKSVNTYNAYKSAGQLTNTSSFKFIIPVFNNMGDSASALPNSGNPNYYLKDLQVNGKTVDGFSYNKSDYIITVPTSTKNVNISATKINSNGSISGTGNIDITSNNVVNIVVTAGNGNKYTYHITFNKSDSLPVPVTDILDNSGVKYNDSYISGINVGTNVSSLIANVKKASAAASIQITDIDGNSKTDSAFKTGDKVIITSGGETKNYNIIIYGDVDGDGVISKVDLLLIQRHVFGYSKLTGIYSEAGNVDKTNGSEPNKIDLLLIQRHVFGYSDIVQ